MKKRLLAVMVFVAFLCTAFPAFADDTVGGSCGENLIWTYDYSAKTLTISGRGDMKSYEVDSLAPWYSSFKNEIVRVNIESGVTSIGKYAFYYCNVLESITIPDSVTNIGEHAFESTKYYENTSNWTDNVLYIGNHLIQAKQNIAGSYNIKDGTKTIADFAFSYCEELTSITIPDSVTSIGVNAFENTAFYNEWYNNSEYCNTLYIGSHLIKADAWAVKKNISDKTISSNYFVKSGTKTIADFAFFYCEELTSITLPDSIVNIGDNAFDGCAGITSIRIPDSAVSIGDNAFNGCTGITSITVDSDNSAYCSENGVLYNKAKTEIIRFPCQKTDTSFIIPNGVTKIADGAFENCGNLTSIIIPDGVTSIGNEAFSNCQGLTSITIPDGVTSIGNSAFYNCYFEKKDDKGKIILKGGLKEVTIPNTVTYIGNNAFLDCKKLENVYYIGNKTDWSNIEKGTKYSIHDNIINYLSGINARFENGNIVVKPINIESGKKVILALYDGDKLVEIQRSSDYSESKKEITFETAKGYTRARVMIWESLSKMTPVCGIKTLRIN